MMPEMVRSGARRRKRPPWPSPRRKELLLPVAAGALLRGRRCCRGVVPPLGARRKASACLRQLTSISLAFKMLHVTCL